MCSPSALGWAPPRLQAIGPANQSSPTLDAPSWARDRTERERNAHRFLRAVHVAEASDAPKQALGAWSTGRDAVETAIRRADAVIGLNSTDRDCVLPLLRDPRRWVAVKPFLDAASFGRQARATLGPPRLIVVAMMRYGDKFASYQLLANALSRLLDLSWSLEVVGDGPARGDVEEALALVKERVTWAGELCSAAIRDRLAAADLFVWPALNEAFGMALLEAQASGLPVVAGGGGGVSEIVVSGIT